MTVAVLPVVIPLGLASHGCGAFPLNIPARFPSYKRARRIRSPKLRSSKRHRRARLKPSFAVA